MPSPKPESTKSPLLWALIGVIVAASAIVALIASSGGGSNSDAPGTTEPGTPRAAEISDTADVSADGDALAPFGAPGTDAAVGMTLPELAAPDLSGTVRTVTAADGPRVVAVVAHWCPHCQAELPVIAETHAQGWAAGVGFTVVSTAQDRTRGNWPPSKWLTSVGVEPDAVLVDDAGATVGAALGTTSFPYLIGVDDAGTVRWRISGEVSPADLQALTAALTDDAQTTVTVER